MLDLCRLIFGIASDLLRSQVALEAEILVLRQQINVLRRANPKRLRFVSIDRLILGGVCRLFPKMYGALAIVRPETVIRWHRAGFRSYWRWKSKHRCGRPAVTVEIRQLIRQMSGANPLWGAPRIHGELLKLGIDVGQTSVAKYMVRRRVPPSQGWRTFLRNHADGIAAMDLFVVPTMSFRLLYGLLIMGHGRRQLLWFGVTAHPTAEWIANQLTEACGWEQIPRYLIRDRDGAYGEIFIRRVRSIGIRDRPTFPRSPWQNAYAERLIGSIRRECLDHIVVFGERHLRHVLLSYMNYIMRHARTCPWIRTRRYHVPARQRDAFCAVRSSADCITNMSGFDLRQAQLLSYMNYYNETRTHLSLAKDAPLSRTVKRAGRIPCRPVLGGLHHQYGRI
jgi:transposase InsO family protein